MIFVPFSNESKVIDCIQSVCNQEYALLRITATMTRKNDTDCNGFFRTMLKNMELVDYDNLEHGGENGIKYDALYIRNGNVDIIPLNFYIVSGQRGDRRFTFNKIKSRTQNREINVDDLLYFSTFVNENGEKKLFIVNLTHNVPSKDELIAIIGNSYDPVKKIISDIWPTMKEIVSNDVWYPNKKGKGKEAPEDIGYTTEDIFMDAARNNSPLADLGGIVELKGKGGKTKDTLFTLRPKFDNTYLSKVESDDSHRVKVFPLYYGYESTKHEGCMDLYVTIGNIQAPQNKKGIYLDVDEKNSKVRLMAPNPKSGKFEVAAFWEFDDLKNSLYLKHPATLWITADKEVRDETTYYNYKSIELSRRPSFSMFIALIKSGDITYDWRGHTSIESKYSGVNKGNAWRIKPAARGLLFGSVEELVF